MKYSNIDRLYKYYAYNKRSVSALRTRTFWFAKPASLNDPFDCKIPFDSCITAEDVKTFLPRFARYKGLSKKQAEKELRQVITHNGQIERDFARIWKSILRQASKKLENSGVFCLSESNSSILMWSRYANAHKGFCVEFERHPDNDLGDYDKTRKVKYAADYPAINALDPKAYDYKFFWKATGWKYEREWRLVKPEGNTAAPMSAEISAITFGLKMSARHKSAIKEILPDLQYRQCTKILSQFGLKIVDL